MQHPKKPLDARLRAAADLALEALRDREDPIVAVLGAEDGFVTAYLLRQRPSLHTVSVFADSHTLMRARLSLDPSIFGEYARLCESTGWEEADLLLFAGPWDAEVSPGRLAVFIGPSSLPTGTVEIQRTAVEVKKKRVEIVLVEGKA